MLFDGTNKTIHATAHWRVIMRAPDGETEATAMDNVLTNTHGQARGVAWQP